LELLSLEFFDVYIFEGANLDGLDESILAVDIPDPNIVEF
jgi:hypothetical protein